MEFLLPSIQRTQMSFYINNIRREECKPIACFINNNLYSDSKLMMLGWSSLKI